MALRKQALAPPLRSRTFPYGLPELTESQQAKCNRHSEMFLRHLDLKEGVLACGGCATTEHPADRGRDPFASIFVTPQMIRIRDKYHGMRVYNDQCMRGCVAKKPTELDGVLDDLKSFGVVCNHSEKHPSFSGIDPLTGDFRTKGLETYSSEFCRDLANLYVRAFASRPRQEVPVHTTEVIPPYGGVASLTRRGRHRPGSTALPDVWPVVEAGALSALTAEAANSGALCRSSH